MLIQTYDSESPFVNDIIIVNEKPAPNKPIKKKNKMNDNTPKTITLKYDPVFGAQLVEIDTPETIEILNNVFEKTKNIANVRNRYNSKMKKIRHK